MLGNKLGRDHRKPVWNLKNVGFWAHKRTSNIFYCPMKTFGNLSVSHYFFPIIFKASSFTLLSSSETGYYRHYLLEIVLQFSSHGGIKSWIDSEVYGIAYNKSSSLRRHLNLQHFEYKEFCFLPCDWSHSYLPLKRCIVFTWQTKKNLWCIGDLSYSCDPLRNLKPVIKINLSINQIWAF